MDNNDCLFDKVYGSLIGSAIGDAMGGPVEGFTYQKIEKDYGLVNTLLPYTEINASVHGPFDIVAGAYTDDSRMSKIFAEAIIKKGTMVTSKDIAKAYIEYFFRAETEFEKGFMEEYYNKAIYMEDKEVFGGQPTNGAIMGVAPFGIISPCNPQKALNDTFDAVFMVGGYARYATSMAAAAISSAMTPNATYISVIEDMMCAVKSHKKRVEDKRWAECHMYPYVGRKTEKLIEDCIEVANSYSNMLEIRPYLYEAVVQDFFADAAESLAIAITFFYQSKGSFMDSVVGCVNFGRDNDSSASIAGAITGALHGAKNIPPEFIELIETVNKGPTFYDIAKKLVNLIKEEQYKNIKVCENITKLMEK